MHKLKKLYAKSIDDKGIKTTLLKHLRDVTIQMCEFISLYKNYLLKLDENINIPRLLIYSAFLHDLGKVHTGFQNQLKDDGVIWGYRHEVLSLAFVRYLKIPDSELPYLLAGIALHHKDLYDIQSKYYLNLDNNSNILSDIPNLYELSNGISQEIINDIEILLKKNLLIKFIEKYNFGFEPYIFNSDFVLTIENIPDEILKNIQIIIDNNSSFIGKSSRGSKAPVNITNIKKGIISRGLVLSSDHLASANNSWFKLSSGVTSLDSLKVLIPILKNPRPHQNIISKKEGNTLLIAPTGSGKTESALLWSIYQREINNSRGRIFVLLPYRASMNAMAKRLRKIFGENEVSLVHGKSLITAYSDLMEQNYSKKEAIKIAKQKETLARMNTSSIRISSPYNIFKPFFGSKGYEANLTNSIDSNMIFDEIHAYDTKITGFTLASAQYITQMFNAKALFMSATMPTHLQDILIENFNTGDIIKPDNNFLEKNIRHKLKIKENLIYDCVEEILFEAKENKKSVLVVVNTVDNAIEIYKKIKESYDSLILLHSRFTAIDRSIKEEELKPESGKILIATQVVEVSLDIDYDTCFTEIAPFESLLQRFGRVNRHALREPAIVNVCVGNREIDKVYNTKYLCQTYKTLLNVDEKIISELMVQELLDKSYPEELKNELKEEVIKNISTFRDSFTRELTPYGVKDKEILSKLKEQWDNLFDGYEIIPKSIYESKIKNKRLSSIEISNYLIPISGKRFFILNKQNLITKDDSYLIIYDDSNNIYNSEIGLCF